MRNALNPSGHESGNPRQPLISAAEAAAYLGMKAQTLAQWRCAKRHPLPYVKVGRTVRYRLADIETWLAGRTVAAAEI